MFIALILSTIPDGMMVFWEYQGIARQRQPVIPAGWVIDSSFDGRFPRGCPGDSVGQTGGTSTHIHTKIGGSTSGSGESTVAFKDGSFVAAGGHYHFPLFGSLTVNPANHLPPYRNFLVIKKIGEDTGLPVGVVMMFVSDLPPGWTVILVDSFPMGSLTPWGKGGTLVHYHTFSGYTGPSMSGSSVRPGSTQAASGFHSHSVNGYTGSTSNLPPYVRVVFARLDVWTEDVPVGAIAMFDAPPSGSSEIGTWASFDTLNLGRSFPRGGTKSDAMSTGGSLFHLHNIAYITVGASGTSSGVEYGPGTSVAINHTHTAYPTTTDSASNLPPYRYTTFWQKTASKAEVAGQKEDESAAWMALSIGNAIKITGPPGLSVRVYDAAGKRLFARETETEELLVTGLMPGVFFVQMEKQGARVVRKVIIR